MNCILKRPSSVMKHLYSLLSSKNKKNKDLHIKFVFRLKKVLTRLFKEFTYFKRIVKIKLIRIFFRHKWQFIMCDFDLPIYWLTWQCWIFYSIQILTDIVKYCPNCLQMTCQLGTTYQFNNLCVCYIAK